MFFQLLNDRPILRNVSHDLIRLGYLCSIGGLFDQGRDALLRVERVDLHLNSGIYLAISVVSEVTSFVSFHKFKGSVKRLGSNLIYNFISAIVLLTIDAVVGFRVTILSIKVRVIALVLEIGQEVLYFLLCHWGQFAIFKVNRNHKAFFALSESPFI